MLDSFASGVQAHPPLLAALHADAAAYARWDAALQTIIDEDATWALPEAHKPSRQEPDPRAAARRAVSAQIAALATAQRKLQAFSPGFWRALERSGAMPCLSVRELSTLFHHAAVMHDGLGFPRVSAELCTAFDGACATAAPHLDAHDVANCFLAYAKLHWQPSDGVTAALLAGVVARAPEMTNQAVANVLWACDRQRIVIPEEAADALLVRCLLARWQAWLVATCKRVASSA